MKSRVELPSSVVAADQIRQTLLRHRQQVREILHIVENSKDVGVGHSGQLGEKVFDEWVVLVGRVLTVARLEETLTSWVQPKM